MHSQFAEFRGSPWQIFHISYLRPPETEQNMPHLSSYLRPVQNSTKFCENIEIPQKWANSVAQLKILLSAQNCGP